jgi:tRNA-Thr(GGU) m(6)t(6)A37 methyltransferase TsaA
MQMDQVSYTPIGVIRTPFQTIEDMPIQPSGAEAVIGQVVVEPQYSDGLTDIEGFSHLILIYHFHQSDGFDLKIKPFLDDQRRGLFATRAPRRPNPIGVSVVTLLERKDNLLSIGRIDVLDGTPLLDIKPFVPSFDAPDVTALGWLKNRAQQARTLRSDGRFDR